MHLSVTGVIFSRSVAETLQEGQTKAFSLGKETDDGVAIFGVEEETQETHWSAVGKGAMVHIDGGTSGEKRRDS